MLGALLLMPLSLAQSSGALSVGEVPKVSVARGQTARQTLTLYVRTGFHVNSNKPNDDWLIPLKLTWDKGAVDAGQVEYPAPQLEKSEFSDKPLSVYSGSFKLVTPFTAAAATTPGATTMVGKLHYQACNNHECLRPQTIEVRVPVEVR